jgi:hypothetical protein
MRLSLTPGQSVYLHGWWNPKPTLTWSDVLSDARLTMQFMLSAGLGMHMLYQLQPDVSRWLRAGRATLEDCPGMCQHWGAHPFKDFNADLSDVIAVRWSVDVMVKTGLTYRNLVDEAGMTHDTMALFTHVTLAGWAALGFSKDDAGKIPEVPLIRLFGMGKVDVLRALK